MHNLGQYIPGGTVIHRLDPRIKIASVFTLSILIFRANPIEAFAISVFLLLVLAIASFTWALIIDTVRPLWFFVFAIFLLHALFPDVPASSSALIPSLTVLGLCRGLFVIWQFICLVLCGAVLTVTTSPEELVGGIDKLLGPLRLLGVPTHDIAMMISVSLRLMPLLLEELERIKAAQAARGADIGAGRITARLKAAAALPAPLIISAIRRADELADAMEARGYRRAPRTALREMRITGLDAAALMSVLVLTAVAMVLHSLDLATLVASKQALALLHH